MITRKPKIRAAEVPMMSSRLPGLLANGSLPNGLHPGRAHRPIRPLWETSEAAFGCGSGSAGHHVLCLLGTGR
jgi:hypothetical protein